MKHWQETSELLATAARLARAGQRAALATVAGQVISAGMSIYFFFFRKNRSYHIRLAYFKPDWALIGEVLLTGFPSLAKNLSIEHYRRGTRRMGVDRPARRSSRCGRHGRRPAGA